MAIFRERLSWSWTVSDGFFGDYQGVYHDMNIFLLSTASKIEGKFSYLTLSSGGIWHLQEGLDFFATLSEAFYDSALHERWGCLGA